MKAVWNLGFRPFFLLGALWACVHMFAWIAFQMGVLELDPHDPVLWHSHEMIFGFASAIVAGFLLTASQNWTGIRGVHGSKLMILVGLWSTARVLSMVSGSFPILYAIVDLLFYPSLAWVLKPYPHATFPKAKPNLLCSFSILTLANVSAHATSFGITPLIPSRSLMILSMFAIILMIGLIGGRIIPFFTSNALPIPILSNTTGFERLSLLASH
ncbi:MAG: NnrS family protein [Bdellovibrionota bacterium]